MRNSLGLATVLVAAASMTALVAQTSKPAPRGDAPLTCAQFKAATARPGVDVRQVNWTLGYLAALEASGARLRPVSDSYVRGWIGAYCDNHDLATIGAATEALVEALKTSR